MVSTHRPGVTGNPHEKKFISCLGGRNADCLRQFGSNNRHSLPIFTAVRILFPGLLNITTCDVTRGAAVKTSEDSRIIPLQNPVGRGEEQPLQLLAPKCDEVDRPGSPSADSARRARCDGGIRASANSLSA